jgi:hypothetical protein
MAIHSLILPESDEEKHYNPGDLANIRADIHSLYRSGAPLFSRQSLCEVRQQLGELGGTCGELYIDGLDGNPVRFTIHPGWRLPARPDDPEEVIA